MFKLLIIFLALAALTGTLPGIIAFFLMDPLRILIAFVITFLLVPMAKTLLGK